MTKEKSKQYSHPVLTVNSKTEIETQFMLKFIKKNDSNKNEKDKTFDQIIYY